MRAARPADTTASSPSGTVAHGRLSYGWLIVVVASRHHRLRVGRAVPARRVPEADARLDGLESRRISGVALWMWVAYGFGSLMWGMLADRWGARRVVVAGGSSLGLGLVAGSRITALWQLYAAFGGLVGVAAGAFYAPLTTAATRWFSANRGLAVALVSAGTGLGTFVVAPLTRWLISSYDWRVAHADPRRSRLARHHPARLPRPRRPVDAAAAAGPNVPLAAIFQSRAPVLAHRAHPFHVLHRALGPDLPPGHPRDGYRGPGHRRRRRSSACPVSRPDRPRHLRPRRRSLGQASRR